MQDSIFTQMLKGNRQFNMVYQDDLTFVILDHKPLTKGHLLVIPKEQIDHIDDCSPELYNAIFATVHKMSSLLRKKLQPLRVALVVHGFEVPHAHVHVIPLYTGSELHLAGKERDTPTQEELDNVAAELTP